MSASQSGRPPRLAVAGAALAVIAGLCTVLPPSARAADTELNVYNWSDYIA